jgi:hypothetical protein
MRAFIPGVRSNYPESPILLPPGRYRVYGFPPMTGLLLSKWIEVTEANSPGCYGPADIEIAKAIPNPARIQDESSGVVWVARGSNA